MLPKGKLTQSNVERYWVRDRSALVECGRRHTAAVNSFDRVKQVLDETPEN